MTPDGPAPLVSVLIPTWNAEATIGRSIASVLEARSDLECVVVDDASSDGTVDAVRRIAERDPRVSLVARAENGGVSAARNDGLDRVRGTWLTLLDADDRFSPGGLDRLVQAATTTDALAVVGQQVWSDGRGRTWLHPLYDVPDIRRAGRKSIAANPGLLYYASPHGKLFRRSITDGLRFEGRVLGDQPWIIRALLRAGDRIEVLDATVYEWIRPGPGDAGGGITATTRSSGRRGVEAAGVARGALELVGAEAQRLLPPAAALAVRRAYLERLLRSDLGVHLAGALRRRDPTLAELLAAIEGFVLAVPTDVLAGSDALARQIVEPPLRRWPWLPATARPAAWSLARAAARQQPGLADHAGGWIGATALRLGLRGDAASGLRRGTAVALLTGAWLAGWPARRLRLTPRR